MPRLEVNMPASTCWIILASMTTLAEAASPNVVSDLGWPPTDACNFLASIPGMRPSTKYTAKITSCGTRYRDVGIGDPLPNNLSYYVSGTQDRAKRLRILLNTNQPQDAKMARAALRVAAETLFHGALKEELPERIARAISSGQIDQWKHGPYVLQLTKTTWPTGRGYEFNFTIRDPSYYD